MKKLMIELVNNGYILSEIDGTLVNPILVYNNPKQLISDLETLFEAQSKNIIKTPNFKVVPKE